MKNQSNVKLPAEVEKIAESVSTEKRNEVQSVLNHVFDGVSKMRSQLETIIVTDENDNVNMKLANTIRLGVRKVRLDSEKIFDAKRAEVQTQMLNFKTEDLLWLKAKQTMQILTKEIEEQAKWKEDTRERFEAEQKELKLQQRMLIISKFAPEMPSVEFELMSDANFKVFVASLEKQYNDKIEAERKAEEERIKKEKAEAEERERIRLENERLRAEAKEKEKQLKMEREKAEAERKALEEKAKMEREKAEAERKAEKEERIKIEEALRAKVEEEAKIKKEAEAKEAAELKAKQDAEKKAKAASDKEKLNNLATLIEELTLPNVNSEQAEEILKNTKILLAKVSSFIREKASFLI